MIAIVFGGMLLAACNGALESSLPKHERPVPAELKKVMKTKGMKLGSPIMLRIFKEENVLEVWKQDHTGEYALLNDYEICKWSGKKGPKIKEGDRQAPEGFYHVTPALMNPNSSYHLSFNMGFPNAYDRANDRTGSFLMIHGACSSAGCYSMTDEYVEEIYALAREAFKGGQKSFQIQALPFRLTPENMAKHVNSNNFEFWTMLKEGSDYFELTKQPPKVDVCEKRYVFNRAVVEGERFSTRTECPLTEMPRSLATAFATRQDKDQQRFQRLLKQINLNPFVEEAEKPRTLSASIMAKPTIGPLKLTDPQPAVVERAPEEPAEESPEEKPGNITEAPQSSDSVPVPSQQPEISRDAPVVTPVPAPRDQAIPASASAEPAVVPVSKPVEQTSVPVTDASPATEKPKAKTDREAGQYDVGSRMFGS